jgi:hypothetical protein
VVCERKESLKYRPVFSQRDSEGRGGGYTQFETFDGHSRVATDSELRDGLRNETGRLMQLITLTSQRQGRDTGVNSAMGFPIKSRTPITFLPEIAAGRQPSPASID